MATIDLDSLLSEKSVGIDEIGEKLDALSASERLDAVFGLDRKGQRALFQKAGAARALTFEDFVPAERAPLEPVPHRGRNTLPLPKKHKLFKKCFCRPEDGSSRLFGYNEAPSRNLVGPGYFVAIPTDQNAKWKERGAIVVDYFQVPDGAVAAGWPKVVPNTQGLQRFIYHRTRDFMRRVSKHVTIGSAFKVEKALDHYFVLVRESS
jgi:hypothetical protein